MKLQLKDFPIEFKRKIAQCIGLWLAEGDTKCNNEITFTNNEMQLIVFFNDALVKLFSDPLLKIRLYIYNNSSKKSKIPRKINVIKYYLDKRANKPYYIWRLASVEHNLFWKQLVEEYKKDASLYSEILKGIFAGEGNIKTGSHSNRTLRISQLKDTFIEKILQFFNIEYSYNEINCSYVITGKWNWDKFAENNLADLHPLKKTKFWQAYKSFKQDYYKKNFLKDSLYKDLIKPLTAKDLSRKYNRSQYRVSEVLTLLKKENKVDNFRVYSQSFWIRKDQNKIIISKLKSRYLTHLSNKQMRTYQIAKYFKVDDKSSYRRLQELKKLGLVQRDETKRWFKIENDKQVIVI